MVIRMKFVHQDIDVTRGSVYQLPALFSVAYRVVHSGLYGLL